MRVSVTDGTFPSSDGVHQVYAVLYRPDPAVPVRGVVQIAHGMIDHSGRYRDLALRLAEEGFAVGIADHLGHGRTARCAEELGFFAEREGVSLVLDDMYSLTRRLKEAFPACPLVLLGHSMGSFLSRLYAVRYGHELAGFLMLGTSGRNPLLPLGRALAGCVRLFAGSHYRSRLIAGMAFMGYNAHFPKSEGARAWLSSDAAYLDRDGSDPYTDFIFTVAAYQDLFSMLGACSASRWFRDYPKELPTLILSGTEDPVGSYGKGPSQVYRRLLMAGATRTELKLYEGARHELFNERCREEFLQDILAFLATVCDA